MNSKRGTRIGVVLAVVSAAGIYLWQTVELGLVFKTVLSASLPLYLIALLSFFATVPLRTKRWAVLLDDIGVATPFRSLNGTVFLSLYLNTVLPAKSGDIYRGYKASGSESTSTVLGTIVVERVFDLVILLGLLAAISFRMVQSFFTGRERVITLALAVAGVTAVVGYIMLFRYGRFEWLREQVSGFWRGLRCIRSVQTFIVFLVFTLSVWGLNIVRIAALAQATDIGLGTSNIILIAVVITILTGLPYTPAGIGVVEGVTTATLIGVGVPASSGFALVLLDRSITVVAVVVLGSLYLGYRMEEFNPRALRNLVDSEETNE